jgi:hypothetical protein
LLATCEQGIFFGELPLNSAFFLYCSLNRANLGAMRSNYYNYYEWPTRKGPVTIERNKSSLWDLCFNGVVIQGNYNDPVEAAEDASKSEIKDIFLKGLSVSWDLQQWFTTPSQQTLKRNRNN